MSTQIVTVKQGKLQGKIDTDYNGGKYYAFHSIPYAKPPLGELRFKAPQPAESWDGIRDATVEGDECYAHHLMFPIIVGSEDCLTLNVYTPELPENNEKLRPVMFWIHGGGFLSGSSKSEVYGPQFLICEDVVVVTINYRLGVLGFLSLEDSSLGVPGNAGLKDMVMALKWVQDNIQQFNGDPNNVTIFGESAGGVSVHYLMLSPMAQNLFHRAIAQSGCALNTWAYGRRCGAELAKHLGCTSDDEREILKALRNATKEELLKAQDKCVDPINACDIRPHGPIVEKPSPNEPAFLAEDPINIIKSGKYAKVPLIIGFTSREGMLYGIMEKKANTSLLITNFENAIPYTLKVPKGSAASKKIAEEIKNFYYGDEEPSNSNKDAFYRLQSDNVFFREIYHSLRFHLATTNTPTYVYRLAVESNLNLYKKFGDIQERGVCHGDDVSYLFKSVMTPEIRPRSLEDRSLRRLVKFWTNFARTGNPNPSAPDDLLNVTWPVAKLNDLKYLNIDENLMVGSNPEAERMQFWDKIFSCKL